MLPPIRVYVPRDDPQNSLKRTPDPLHRLAGVSFSITLPSFPPAHTLPELPPHRTPGIQPLPLTQPKKLRQQNPPHPHNSYQLCSRPLQNTYEKLYSTHSPPSIRYNASSTQHTAFRNSVFTEHEHAGSKNSRSYSPRSSENRNSRSRTTTSAPHNTYQFCSRSLQNTYEKVYSHSPGNVLIPAEIEN